MFERKGVKLPLYWAGYARRYHPNPNLTRPTPSSCMCTYIWSSRQRHMAQLSASPMFHLRARPVREPGPECRWCGWTGEHDWLTVDA